MSRRTKTKKFKIVKYGINKTTKIKGNIFDRIKSVICIVNKGK